MFGPLFSQCTWAKWFGKDINPVHVFIKPVMHCIEAKSDALSLPIESVAVIFCLTMISFNNLSSCLFLKVCEFITCVILF